MIYMDTTKPVLDFYSKKQNFMSLMEIKKYAK